MKAKTVGLVATGLTIASLGLGYLLWGKKKLPPQYYSFDSTYSANDALGNLTGNTPSSDLGDPSNYSGTMNNPQDLAQACGGNVDSLGNPTVTTTDEQVQATTLPSDWQAILDAARANYPDAADVIDTAEEHLREAIAWKESWDAAGGMPIEFQDACIPGTNTMDITRSTNYLVAQSLLNNVQTYESYKDQGGSRSYDDWGSTSGMFGYYGAAVSSVNNIIQDRDGTVYVWDKAGGDVRIVPSEYAGNLIYIANHPEMLRNSSPSEMTTMAGGAYADTFNNYIAHLAETAGVADNEIGEVARLRRELARHQAIAADDLEKAQCPNPKEVYPHLAQAFPNFDDPDEGWVAHFMRSYNGQLKSIASYQGYIENCTVASEQYATANTESAAADQAATTASALAEVESRAAAEAAARAAAEAAAAAQAEAEALAEAHATAEAQAAARAAAAAAAAAAAQAAAQSQATSDAWDYASEEVQHYQDMGYTAPSPSEPGETPSETYQAASQEHEDAASEASSTASSYEEAANTQAEAAETAEIETYQDAVDFLDSLEGWTFMSGKISPDAKAFAYPQLGIYDVPGELNPDKKINWAEYEKGRQLASINSHLDPKTLPSPSPSFRIGYEHGVEGKQLRLAK